MKRNSANHQIHVLHDERTVDRDGQRPRTLLELAIDLVTSARSLGRTPAREAKNDPSSDLCQTSRCGSEGLSRRNSRRSHAFASFQSRFTVSVDTPRTSAVSSTVNPPKNRNSTT